MTCAGGWVRFRGLLFIQLISAPAQFAHKGKQPVRQWLSQLVSRPDRFAQFRANSAKDSLFCGAAYAFHGASPYGGQLFFSWIVPCPGFNRPDEEPLREAHHLVIERKLVLVCTGQGTLVDVDLSAREQRLLVAQHALTLKTGEDKG